MKRSQKKRQRRGLPEDVARKPVSKDFVALLSRRAKEQVTTTDVNVIDKFATALLIATMHSSKIDELGRVHATLGVLRTVRTVLRTINKDQRFWTGREEVFPTINDAANELAEYIVTGIKEANDEAGASLFVRNTFGFPEFRPELQFHPPDMRNEQVPFGEELPQFEPAEIDEGVLVAIERDIVELTTANLRTLRSADDAENAVPNMIELLIGFVALGKCALSGWSPRVQYFLDFFACNMVDVDWDRATS